MDVHRNGLAVVEPVETGVAFFRRRSFDRDPLLDNSIPVSGIRHDSEPERIVPVTVSIVAGMVAVHIIHRDLEPKDCVRRRARTGDLLVDRQIASTVIRGIEYVLVVVSDLIGLVVDGVVVRSLRAGRIVRQDQDFLDAVNDHRAVDVCRQIPAVAEVLGLDDRVFVTGLLDLAAYDLAVRDVDLCIRRLPPGVRTGRNRLSHRYV